MKLRIKNEFSLTQIAISAIITLTLVIVLSSFERYENYTVLSLKENPILYAYVVRTDEFTKFEMGKTTLDTDGTPYGDPWIYWVSEK